eukprot:4069183-Prymnesium_polylepis.1
MSKTIVRGRALALQRHVSAETRPFLHLGYPIRQSPIAGTPPIERSALSPPDPSARYAADIERDWAQRAVLLGQIVESLFDGPVLSQVFASLPPGLWGVGVVQQRAVPLVPQAVTHVPHARDRIVRLVEPQEAALAEGALAEHEVVERALVGLVRAANAAAKRRVQHLHAEVVPGEGCHDHHARVELVLAQRQVAAVFLERLGRPVRGAHLGAREPVVLA